MKPRTWWWEWPNCCTAPKPRRYCCTVQQFKHRNVKVSKTRSDPVWGRRQAGRACCLGTRTTNASANSNSILAGPGVIWWPYSYGVGWSMRDKGDLIPWKTVKQARVGDKKNSCKRHQPFLPNPFVWHQLRSLFCQYPGSGERYYALEKSGISMRGP